MNTLKNFSYPKPTSTKAEFIVVANRLPIDLIKNENGNYDWKPSPGGLVTALETILQKNNGAWIGWPGIMDFISEPIQLNNINMYPVTLSAKEYEQYYEGFSNETLWPLYHDLIVKPSYHRPWWEAYKQVNQKFAQLTAQLAAPQATVWIQDYQLQLVPAILRKLRPDIKIGFFLHIPFPAEEVFLQLPWRKEIILGLLGADLIGFQLTTGANNFLTVTKKLTGYIGRKSAIGIRSKYATIDLENRKIKVGAFPISIDSQQISVLARETKIKQKVKQLRRDLGNPKHILLGVDRLDYTKGIDFRLKALRELLTDKKINPNDITMIQLATPSRERVQDYIRMRSIIEQEVSRINGEFGGIGKPTVNYIHKQISKTELIAYYCTADLMLVTPLKDGMNLVAKEYVACRNSATGSLILSEFAGAAQELIHSYLVNPYDLENMKHTIMTALTADPIDNKRRMRSLRRQVLSKTVEVWAKNFLSEFRG